MEELKNKRIITVATTGAWPTKENTPNVPLEPEEIAEEIYNCWKEGAAVAAYPLPGRPGPGSDGI